MTYEERKKLGPLEGRCFVIKRKKIRPKFKVGKQVVVHSDLSCDPNLGIILEIKPFEYYSINGEFYYDVNIDGFENCCPGHVLYRNVNEWKRAHKKLLKYRALRLKNKIEVTKQEVRHD